MYGYYSSFSDTLEAIQSALATIQVVLAILLIVAAIANICAVYQLINVAQKKGHYLEGTGLLWFIGLFGSALVLGALVCALPDQSNGKTTNLEGPDSPAAMLPEV